MKRIIIQALLCFIGCAGFYPCLAQELFVFTDPASNMPAHSIGLRAASRIMWNDRGGGVNTYFLPEVMFGCSQRLMLHAEGFISNRNGGFSLEGGGIYAKYRFYTDDTLFRHFRAAAFGRITTNNGTLRQEEININGYNSGYQFGLIATQLLHRQAFSATLSMEHAIDNFDGNEFPALQSRDAVSGSLSTGRLLLPKHYTSYKQVNFNVLLELLAQQSLGSDRRYVDIAPSIQFIFNSQTRVDIGYRQELYSNMSRTSPNGLLLRMEHLLFNAF